MSDDGDGSGSGLEGVIAEVYRGPVEEFVPRRDAAVKELRAADRRDDAETVKRLRKPNRIAWALDAAVLDDAAPVERVASAVVAMIEAQDGKGDLRQASDLLRSTVRELAAAAAHAAADAGQRVDPAALVPAVMAVIGDAEAFAALRGGRLADVPSGGGLDVLTGAPPLAAPLAPPRAVASPPRQTDPEAVAAAQRVLDEAEGAASASGDQATAAEQVVSDAEAAVETADQRLREAEDEARSARARLREAQHHAKAARQQSRDADRAAARARAKLATLTDP